MEKLTFTALTTLLLPPPEALHNALDLGTQRNYVSFSRKYVTPCI